MPSSLLNGINHVAIVTADLDRFVAFYTEMFELQLIFAESGSGLRHAILRISKDSWLHPVELPSNEHAKARPAMFERGHLDHIALMASSAESFERIRSRLVQRRASDGVVESLGPFLALWFQDPDGMRGEVTLIVDDELRGIHEPRATE